ncbi:MAG: hypothetical protein C5B49_08095 [Bdellovibrio sp.]|nr:MAG: hypothetical protein C5B49_08095 [Bdellovibrio sp.]
MNPLRPTQIVARLSQLSRTLDRDYQGLALEFAIERLVARLTTDPKLAKHLVFKGGFVMLKIHFSGRATVDLDTSIHGLSMEEAEKRASQQITSSAEDGLWMGAIEPLDLDHQTKYRGRRLIIRFSIGEPKVAYQRLAKLVLDIGVADVITPAPVSAELISILEPSEPVSWSVYPLETIIAEKLHALVSHGSANSRAKDVYDLTILLKKAKDTKTLRRAISATFKHRETDIPESFSAFWRKLDKTILKRSAGAIFLATGEKVDFDQLTRDLTGLLEKC